MKMTEQDDRLWRAYHDKPSVENRNALLLRHQRLVDSTAARLWSRLPPHLADYDDLRTSGFFGLMDALRTYDLSRNIQFATYATLRIRGAMIDEIRKLDWVPRLVRRKASLLETAGREFYCQHNRPAEPEELAAALGITVGELEALQRETAQVFTGSVETVALVTDDGKELKRRDTSLPPAEPSYEEDRREQIESLRRMTKGLSDTERLIIIGYYFESMTMREIGEQLGLSESRVSQMHSRIINRRREEAGLPPIAKGVTGRGPNRRPAARPTARAA